MFTYNMDSFYSVSYKTSISMPLVCADMYPIQDIGPVIVIFKQYKTIRLCFCFYYIVIWMFNSYFYFVLQPAGPDQPGESITISFIINPLAQRSNQPISLVIMTALLRSHFSSTFLQPTRSSCCSLM